MKGEKNGRSMPEVEPLFSSAETRNHTLSSTMQTSLFEEDVMKFAANIHSDIEDETMKGEDNGLQEINLIPYAHKLADEIKQLIEITNSFFIRK